MTRDFVFGILAAMLVAVVGCGDDGGAPDSGVPDGGTDSGTDSGAGPTLPEIPWLADGAPPLMLTPCPGGWREVVVNGVTECDPYPAEGVATCPAGQAHFPGEAGCRTVGEACPAGDYATSLPTPLPTDGSVVYVRAAAAAGGDGSLASPYRALSQVPWAALAPTATVALAGGTYRGTLPVKEGVRVVGACAEGTRVTGDGGISIVTAIDGVGEAVVENLTVGDVAEVGVRIDGGRSITLEGVIVEGNRGIGIWVLGAASAATVRDSVVRGTAPQPGSGRFGRGVAVERGGAFTATRLVVEGNRDVGVFAGGIDTAVSLTDTVIRDTQPQASDDLHGRGIQAQDGVALVGERLLVEGNQDIGILVTAGRTTATLADTIVRDTQSNSVSGNAGRGIDLEYGAQLTATRLLVQRNHEFAVFVSHEGTAMDLTDTIIRDTARPTTGGEVGRGIGIQQGGQLTATRLLVESSLEVGLSVLGDGSVARLTDTLVRDTAPLASDGTLGRGVQVQGGARLDGDRLVIEASLEFGLAATDAAEVDLRDTSITGVLTAACATTTCTDRVYGHGVASLSSQVRLTRFEVRDAATCGLFLSPSASSTAPTGVDLQSGVVAESGVGACIQVDGYDTGRLTNEVQYIDNGTNLDSTTLPVPAPLSSIDP